MALTARSVPILLKSGIDTKSDPRTAPAGTLLEVENMFYQRTGELRVRNGYTALTGTGNTNGGLDGLFITPQGQLFGIGKDVNFLGKLSPVRYFPAPTNRWGGNSGTTDVHYPSTFASVSGVAGGDIGLDGATDLFDPDMAVVANGFAITTWNGNDGPTIGIRYAVASLTGSRVAGSGGVLGGASGRPALAVANGVNVCMLYPDNSGTPSLLLRSTFTTSSFGVTSTATLVLNGVSAAQPWIDAKAIPGSGNIVAAYRSSAGGVSVLTFNPNTLAIVAGPVNIAAADATMTLGFLDDSLTTGNFYLATVGSTAGVVVRTLSAALAVTATNTIDATATANVRNVTGHIRASATDYVVLWDIDATPTYNMKIRRGIWTGSAAVADLANSYGLYSRSFLQSDGKYYFIGSYDSTVQASYSVLETENIASGTTAEPVSQAQIMPGIAGGRRTVQNSLTSFTLNGGVAYGALPKKQKLTTAGGSVLSNRAISTVSLAMTTAFKRPREFGGTMFLPGGIVMRDDGFQTSWATCPFFLESPSLVSSATGSMTASGAYSYSLVLRRNDANGRITRSPQSIPVAVTLGGGDGRVTLTIQVPRLRPLAFAMDGDYIAEIYRSGPAASGATGYNKVGEQYIFPGAATFTFIDSMSDANANLGETIYTTGNVLENFVTPSCTLMEAVSSRLWIVNAEYPSELWYSKEYKPGLGIGFHPLNTLRLEGDGYGAITALAAMDGRLIAFKSTAIYVISGDGPNDLGQGSFNAPQAASLNVGTVLPGSVVATPDGIMFQAAQGIYLLSRGLAVTYLGKAVEAYTLAANVVDASLVSGTTQVRFVMANGRCLVWDYDKQEWTTFLLAVSGSTITACANAPTGWCYALATGVVMQETAGLGTDNGSAIVVRLATSHLAFAGVQGYQRVRAIEILGEFVGAHTLNAFLEFNYSGFNSQTDAIVGAAPYQFEIPIGDGLQKSESVKLTLTASSSAGGFRLSGINVRVGIKQGQYKMPSSRRMLRPTPPGTPILWYDGQDIDRQGNLSLTDGQRVALWANKGSLGSTWDLTNGTPSFCSFFRRAASAGLLNNLSALENDGSHLSFITINTPATQVQPLRHAILCKAGSLASALSLFDGGAQRNTAFTGGAGSGALFGFAGNTNPNPVTLVAGQWGLLIMDFNGASSFMRLDGTQATNGNAGTQGIDLFKMMNIWPSGLVAEHACWQGASPPSAATIEAYFWGKYNVTPQ